MMTDENEDFIRDGLPVNVGEAARLARDQRAREDLQEELRAEARVRADMH
jgi:hypothetical protein